MPDLHDDEGNIVLPNKVIKHGTACVTRELAAKLMDHGWVQSEWNPEWPNPDLVRVTRPPKKAQRQVFKLVADDGHVERVFYTFEDFMAWLCDD